MLISHQETYYDYLPTPPVEFWEAWSVFRSFLLKRYAEDTVGRLGFDTFRRNVVEHKQMYDLLSAYWIMDYHYERFLSAEESYSYSIVD